MLISMRLNTKEKNRKRERLKHPTNNNSRIFSECSIWEAEAVDPEEEAEEDPEEDPEVAVCRAIPREVDTNSTEEVEVDTWEATLDNHTNLTQANT